MIRLPLESGGGGGGGGGYRGEWEAVSYGAGDIVTHQGYLFGTPEAADDSAPISNDAVMDDAIADYAQYSVSDLGSGQYELVNNSATYEYGILLSPTIDLSSVNKVEVNIAAILYGDADRMHVGLSIGGTVGTVNRNKTYYATWSSEIYGACFDIYQEKFIQMSRNAETKSSSVSKSVMMSADASTFKDYMVTFKKTSSSLLNIEWEGFSYDVPLSGTHDWASTKIYIASCSGGLPMRNVLKNTITANRVAVRAPWELIGKVATSL